MLQLSLFKHQVVQRAIKLGFQDTLPNVNADFWYHIRDVNEDGARTVHYRHVFYGNSTPWDRGFQTIWLRQDNKKIFRYDYVGALIEETHISDLHEANY